VSRRRKLSLAGLALLTLGASMLVSPAPAGAGTLSKSAWWYRARTSDPSSVVPPAAGPLPATVPPSPAPPTPGPPTVPEGSVLVEGTAEGATAIAAMTFTMTKTESAPTLTVTPSASSQVPDDAVVLACRAAVEWPAPDQNPGAWEEKPLVACDQSVQGIPGEGTITFALAPLCQSCTTLDVVLVPGTIPSPAAAPSPAPATIGSSFTLSFDTKSGAKLVTTESSSASSGSSSFTPTPSYSSAPSAGFSRPGSVSTPPVPIAQPALEPQDQAPTVPQQTALPPTPKPASNDKAQGVGFLILLAGLAFAGLAYVTPARPEDGLVGLGRFQRVAPVDAETIEPVSGGLGRFARPRTGPPPALS
jgi:hypothetical protein